jgi:hypothetical protein
MMAKNLPLSEAIIKIGCRYLLDIISATKSLFAGQAKYFIAVIHAHFAFLGWLIASRSESVFPVKKNRNWQGYYRRSVVWKHFILGKKKFTEIVENKN